MSSQVIKDQLNKVQIADLSNFVDNICIIKQRKEIKLEEDKSYIIRIKPTILANQVIINNWNNGKIPTFTYLKIVVSHKMGKMVKVEGIEYNINSNTDTTNYWTGWLSIDDIEILRALEEY